MGEIIIILLVFYVVGKILKGIFGWIQPKQLQA